MCYNKWLYYACTHQKLVGFTPCDRAKHMLDKSNRRMGLPPRGVVALKRFNVVTLRKNGKNITESQLAYVRGTDFSATEMHHCLCVNKHSIFEHQLKKGDVHEPPFIENISERVAQFCDTCRANIQNAGLSWNQYSELQRQMEKSKMEIEKLQEDLRAHEEISQAEFVAGATEEEDPFLAQIASQATEESSDTMSAIEFDDLDFQAVSSDSDTVMLIPTESPESQTQFKEEITTGDIEPSIEFDPVGFIPPTYADPFRNAIDPGGTVSVPYPSLFQSEEMSYEESEYHHHLDALSFPVEKNLEPEPDPEPLPIEENIDPQLFLPYGNEIEKFEEFQIDSGIKLDLPEAILVTNQNVAPKTISGLPIAAEASTSSHYGSSRYNTIQGSSSNETNSPHAQPGPATGVEPNYNDQENPEINPASIVKLNVRDVLSHGPLAAYSLAVHNEVETAEYLRHNILKSLHEGAKEFVKDKAWVNPTVDPVGPLLRDLSYVGLHTEDMFPEHDDTQASSSDHGDEEVSTSGPSNPTGNS